MEHDHISLRGAEREKFIQGLVENLSVPKPKLVDAMRRAAAGLGEEAL